ncbi:MAG: RNA repair transcriptional activator RtcR [Myxococcota bacterium]
MAKPVVVIGLLGKRLDFVGRRADRWERWRPTISLFQQRPALEVRRLELLYQPADEALCLQVVDDIHRVAPEVEVAVHRIALTDPWDFEEVYGRFYDFVHGYRFKSGEDYLVHISTGTHVEQICLFLLTESRRIPGRLIQTSPPKQEDRGRPRHAIVDLDLSRYDRLLARFAAERTEGHSFLKSGIDTKNPAFNALIERIERVAIASKEPLLLLGPTGAGKSKLARRIYELKRSRHQLDGAFVDINCATIRGDGAMSALFGHLRGAFTGAAGERPGLLRQADGGLLFLDEIGELGSDEQAMLLRAVEEKVFYPVGADKEVRSSFQLIAGTNRDLSSDARQGRFREDLLARLNLWTFRLPGLAQRREDLAPNLDFELARVSELLGRRISINKEARAAFLAFGLSEAASWPANFRDLGAAVLRMATLAPQDRIDRPTVLEEIQRLQEAWSAAEPGEDELSLLLGETQAKEIDRFDRAQLVEVIRVCRSSPSLSAAGRSLFDRSRLAKRSTNDADRLRKYLMRFGLSFEAIRERAAQGGSYS